MGPWVHWRESKTREEEKGEGIFDKVRDRGWTENLTSKRQWKRVDTDTWHEGVVTTVQDAGCHRTDSVKGGELRQNFKPKIRNRS